MELFLVYVKYIGKTVDNTATVQASTNSEDSKQKKKYEYFYDLYFSETPEVVWGIDWDIDNPSSCIDLTPDNETYSKICRIKSKLPLKTFEETTCYPMEYVIPRIVALSWIDIENLEEYPENGRMVLHFNDSFDKVKDILSVYSIDIEE